MRKLTEVEQLFRAHYSSMYRAAKHIVKDNQAAKDIVQEAFYQFWKSKDQLDSNADVREFLFRTTVKLSVEHIKKNSSGTSLAEELKLSKSISSYNPFDKSFSRELKSGFMKVIMSLSPRCQAIFMMSTYNGMGSKEIAAAMGISVRTVESQMSIALKQLEVDEAFSRKGE
ncbi:MAG: RNA polymerase sigma-70 factor [Bacteroidota bacterium]